MACPHLKFVTVYKKSCNVERRDVPEDYRRMYCNVSTPKKGAPGYKACPYYARRGPGF